MLLFETNVCDVVCVRCRLVCKSTADWHVELCLDVGRLACLRRLVRGLCVMMSYFNWLACLWCRRMCRENYMSNDPVILELKLVLCSA